MKTSLADIARARFLDEMVSSLRKASPADIEAGVATKSPHFVLVLDSHTLKMISSVCKRYDLSERGAIFIEQIDKPRQPFPDLDVVYFLAPSDASIAALLSDHKSSESLLYRYSHVFLSTRLSEQFFSKLIENKIFAARCKNLVEFNLDFILFDHRVFHCDSVDAVFHIGLENAGNAKEEKIVTKHVSSLLTLCASIGEKPVIRYMNASPISKRVAASLRTELDLLAKQQLKSRGTSLLIVDRSIETSPMFLHDFFYEALALDILDGIESDNTGVQWALGATTDTATSVVPSFEYKTMTGKGEEKRKVLLSEFSDPFWGKYKYEHFRVVSDLIRGELGELTSKIAVSPSEDPLATLRKLPEYQDTISKLGVHIELSKKLMDVFEKLKLMDVAKVEQELATGIDDDGKEINCAKIFSSLAGLLGHVGPEERLRVVLLYLSQVSDISESTVTDLLSTIGFLDSDFQQIVRKFLSLNIHKTKLAPSITGPDGVMANQKRSSLTTPTVQATRHVCRLDKGAIKRNKNVLKNSKFIHCRFQSELANAVEHCLANKLDSSAFPNIGGTGTSNYTAVGETSSAPGGGGAAAWAAAALEEERARSENRRQKLIVFVIGGITLTEIRELEDLTAKYGVDVVAGGSCVLTSKRFIEILSKH